MTQSDMTQSDMTQSDMTQSDMTHQTGPQLEASASDGARLFASHRSHLLGIAYRMLGSMSDAEDVLQEAFLRVRGVEELALDSPRAYFTKVVSRLCLDHLKSARVRRETYVGPWLPEPLVGFTPDEEAWGETSILSPGLRDDVSMALLVALERLSPLERAAFLLHDVFDMDYSEVATALEREETACRALAARGRKHIREAKPRFPAEKQHSQRLVSAFAQSVREGNVSALRDLLTEDVRLIPDGGGRVSSAQRVLHGVDRVTRFLVGVQKRFGSYRGARLVSVGGTPGLVLEEQGDVTQVTAFEITGNRISAVYVVRNPDKLKHILPDRPSSTGFGG